MTVINLNRSEAKEWSGKAENSIWITIGEPRKNFTHIHNPILDKFPTLRLEFYDITKITIDKDTGEKVYPPGKNEAKLIVDFILAHPGKNVIVNCAAGKSRSGAIAQFCNKLGFEWGKGRDRAIPNPLLYSLMWDYYNTPGRPVYGYNS